MNTSIKNNIGIKIILHSVFVRAVIDNISLKFMNSKPIMHRVAKVNDRLIFSVSNGF